MSKVLDSLRLKKVDVLGKGHGPIGERSGEIVAGTGTLAVGEILRLDCTPGLAGKEFPGNDPTVNGPTFHKQDDSNNGKSPIIEYRWGTGEREFSNSGNDPFHLGSYEDNGGCTPTLKLTEPIGQGRNEVWVQAYVRPEYNDGQGVESNKITFWAD